MPAQGPVPGDIDQALTIAAFDAKRGDLASRDALFRAVEPRVSRVVRRCAALMHCRRGGVVEPDDIAQEAFLVFLAVLDRWPERGSFVAYFMATFPHELRHVARRLTWTRIREAPLGAATSEALVDDTTAAGEAAMTMLRELADSLGEPDRSILLRRVRDGVPMAAIARELGISRRTVQRHWTRLVQSLRPRFDGSQESGVRGRS
jgi:RNA polymerase sigma factor (sigma-70 family)